MTQQEHAQATGDDTPTQTGQAEQAGQARGKRKTSTVFVVFIVIVLLGVIGVLVRNTFGSPDGEELASLIQQRALLNVTEYVKSKKVDYISTEGDRKPMNFEVGKFRFITPVEGLATLPEVVEFEIDLITTGHPDNLQGKATGAFHKGESELRIKVDQLTFQNDLVAGYRGRKVH